MLFEGLAARPGREAPARPIRSPATPPPKTAQAGSDEGNDQGGAGPQAGAEGRLGGRKLASDDPAARRPGSGQAPLYGHSYKIDDEGVRGPARLADRAGRPSKSLLMSRTPRKGIEHSNGHARAPRFAASPCPGRHAAWSAGRANGPSRPALLDELAKIAKGAEASPLTSFGCSTTEARWPAARPTSWPALFSFGRARPRPASRGRSLVYRLEHGKETLVRGVLMENLLPRSLKDITAVGSRAQHVRSTISLDGGAGISRACRLHRSSAPPLLRRRCGGAPPEPAGTAEAAALPFAAGRRLASLSAPPGPSQSAAGARPRARYRLR